MLIPSWDECSRKDDEGTELTAVEQFIYDNEPGGHKDEEIFRRQLQAVVNELT